MSLLAFNYGESPEPDQLGAGAPSAAPVLASRPASPLASATPTPITPPSKGIAAVGEISPEQASALQETARLALESPLCASRATSPVASTPSIFSASREALGAILERINQLSDKQEAAAEEFFEAWTQARDGLVQAFHKEHTMRGIVNNGLDAIRMDIASQVYMATKMIEQGEKRVQAEQPVQVQTNSNIETRAEETAGPTMELLPIGEDDEGNLLYRDPSTGLLNRLICEFCGLTNFANIKEAVDHGYHIEGYLWNAERIFSQCGVPIAPKIKIFRYDPSTIIEQPVESVEETPASRSIEQFRCADMQQPSTGSRLFCGDSSDDEDRESSVDDNADRELVVHVDNFHRSLSREFRLDGSLSPEIRGHYRSLTSEFGAAEPIVKLDSAAEPIVEIYDAAEQVESQVDVTAAEEVDSKDNIIEKVEEKVDTKERIGSTESTTLNSFQRSFAIEIESDGVIKHDYDSVDDIKVKVEDTKPKKITRRRRRSRKNFTVRKSHGRKSNIKAEPTVDRASFSNDTKAIVKDESDGMFVIEKILARRTVRAKKVQYLVKWLGYPGEDSWEPIDSLMKTAPLVIKEYETQRSKEEKTMNRSWKRKASLESAEGEEDGNSGRSYKKRSGDRE
ncbi:MAG: hypothetical protein M1829_002066 [Trizodia sp. TS-e1964]|nr:MAG: hypothetical protein M1829_002066 [Trizodia sp. TS-e1964]